MQPASRAEALRAGLLAALRTVRATLGAGLAFQAQTADRAFTLGSTDDTSAVVLPPLMARLRRGAPSVDLRVVGYGKDGAGLREERRESDLALGGPDGAPQLAAPEQQIARAQAARLLVSRRHLSRAQAVSVVSPRSKPMIVTQRRRTEDVTLRHPRLGRSAKPRIEGGGP